MMMNYDRMASCLFLTQRIQFTSPGGFMVLRGGGAFSAMVGGVELVRRDSREVCKK